MYSIYDSITLKLYVLRQSIVYKFRIRVPKLGENILKHLLQQ